MLKSKSEMFLDKMAFSLTSDLGCEYGGKEPASAPHAIVAAGVREQRRLIVMTTDELLGIVTPEELIRLIKLKLCDLAVKRKRTGTFQVWLVPNDRKSRFGDLR